ncbi:hypothetical protein ACFQZR_24030 [Paenibacillus sp. GCM10027629]|uniref:hypothetical protein n=1 Tax=Paenibacillus sp. GCM10027629 TaxID=3273414 RepID=UPI003632F207
MKTLTILLALLLLTSCSASQIGEKTDTVTMNHAIASIASPSVKWNDRVYHETTEEVTDIGEEIGEIETQSTDEMLETPNNHATSYPPGTKLFAIQGVDTSEAIAIQASESMYYKAVTKW